MLAEPPGRPAAGRRYSSSDSSTMKPAPVAVRAGRREHLDQPLGHALAGHLEQAELGDREHLGAGLVAGERLAERLFDRFAVLHRISMSMKSMTMMPPMSRSRSSRAIASAASRLFRYTVSSRFDVPTFLPVFTSITVSASVRSITSDPPDGSHTLRSSALCSCSCTWNFSKIGQVLGLARRRTRRGRRAPARSRRRTRALLRRACGRR